MNLFGIEFESAQAPIVFLMGVFGILSIIYFASEAENPDNNSNAGRILISVGVVIICLIIALMN